MIYANYEFYKENWSGKIPQDEYTFLATQASKQIDYLTFNRITVETVNENIMLCQCELAVFLYQREISLGLNANQEPPVKAETVDSYRVEYVVSTTTAKITGEVDNTVTAICQKWLTRPTNLMYAGG
jgi:uncharacterized protein YfeS